MKISAAFTALLLCCSLGCSAQTALVRALDYDTFLAQPIREKGPNRRLDYRESVVVNGQKQTQVVYLYTKGKRLALKAFVIRDSLPDSLVAYAEQPVTSRGLRHVYARYFAQVYRYPKYPRYEYSGPAEQPSSVLPAAEPKWVVTAIQVETGKQGLKAMYHHMNPASYEAEDAAIIRKMNADFDALHKAISEYAQSIGLPLSP